MLSSFGPNTPSNPNPKFNFFRDTASMNETGALFILFICLAITVVLLFILAFYCILHCWCTKPSSTASERGLEANNTEITQCDPKARTSFYNKHSNMGRRVFGATLNTADNFLVRRYSGKSWETGKFNE